MLLQAFGKSSTNAVDRNISNMSFYFSCRKALLKVLGYFTWSQSNNYVILNSSCCYSVPQFSHQTTRANIIYCIFENSQTKWHVLKFFEKNVIYKYMI